MPHAEIKGKWGEKFLSGAKAVIYEINNLPVNETWKGAAANRRIPVGNNSVYVSTGSGSRLIASAYMEFYAKAGKSYIVTSHNLGEFILFEIYEESTNEVVAERKASKQKAPPAASPSYIPIIVPSG